MDNLAQQAYKLFESLSNRLDAIDVKLGMLMEQKADREAAARLAEDLRGKTAGLEAAIPK